MQDELYEDNKKGMPAHYGMKNLCMKALGFKYEVRKKGFYVDGHEN